MGQNYNMKVEIMSFHLEFIWILDSTMILCIKATGLVQLLASFVVQHVTQSQISISWRANMDDDKYLDTYTFTFLGIYKFANHFLI